MDFFNSNLFKNITNIILIFISLITCSIMIYTSINLSNKDTIEYNNIIEETKEEIIEEEQILENNKIYIDIKGAIKNPGVYEVDNNSKVIDVINIAGGLKSNANTKYLNLSKTLSNESVIYIYTNTEINNLEKNSKESEPIEECKCSTEIINTCVDNKASIIEVGENTIKEENNTKETQESNIININTASKDKLTTLTGIGESKANSIIEYRNKNGNFKSIEDIKNVSGISDTIYEKIKDYITV